MGEWIFYNESKRLSGLNAISLEVSWQIPLEELKNGKIRRGSCGKLAK
jgi:hypothetical protein